MDKPINDDPLAAPIRGRYPDVVNAAIHFALRGDFRARRVTVGPRSAIITPERRPDGRIDGSSIAAQVYAMCMDAYSATATYTNGYCITRDGNAHIHPDPTDTGV